MSGDKTFSCNSSGISVYQIYNFSTQKHILKIYKLSWIYLCRHGLHSTPPMFWAKLQITGTLKCVTLSTVFYTLQFRYKIRSLYCIELPGKRGYMIYTRFYIFQTFGTYSILYMCIFIKQHYCKFPLLRFNIFYL